MTITDTASQHVGIREVHVVGACHIVQSRAVDVLVQASAILVDAADVVIAKADGPVGRRLELHTGTHRVLSAKDVLVLTVGTLVSHTGERRTLIIVTVVGVLHAVLAIVGVFIFHIPSQILVQRTADGQAGTPRSAQDILQIALVVTVVGNISISLIVAISVKLAVDAVPCLALQTIPRRALDGKSHTEGILLDGTHDAAHLKVQSVAVDALVVIEGVVQNVACVIFTFLGIE